MSSVDKLGSLNGPLEPAGPDEHVINAEIIDVGCELPAVLLPGGSEVTVPAKTVETVVVALAVPGEVESSGHHTDVDEIIHDPDSNVINTLNISSYLDWM